MKFFMCINLYKYIGTFQHELITTHNYCHYDFRDPELMAMWHMYMDHDGWMYLHARVDWYTCMYSEI